MTTLRDLWDRWNTPHDGRRALKNWTVSERNETVAMKAKYSKWKTICDQIELVAIAGVFSSEEQEWDEKYVQFCITFKAVEPTKKGWHTRLLKHIRRLEVVQGSSNPESE